MSTVRRAHPTAYQLKEEVPGHRVFIEQRGAWVYLVTYDVRGPVPVAVEARITLSPEWQADVPPLGEGLRSMPLRTMQQDAKEELAKRLPADHRDAVPFPGESTARMTSEEDYARFAADYVRLVEAGDREPIATLARSLNTSRNTISGRMRKARELGLLTRPPGKRGRSILTSKARGLINQDDG